MGYLDTETDKWVVDGKTDGGQEYHSVEGYLFKSRSGKWEYKVKLDYSDTWHRLVNGLEFDQWQADHPDETREYMEPGEAAWLALATATDRGTSGVTIRSNAQCEDSMYGIGLWTLVVLDPPNGWPIMSNRVYPPTPA